MIICYYYALLIIDYHAIPVAIQFLNPYLRLKGPHSLYGGSLRLIHYSLIKLEFLVSSNVSEIVPGELIEFLQAYSYPMRWITG